MNSGRVKVKLPSLGLVIIFSILVFGVWVFCAYFYVPANRSSYRNSFASKECAPGFLVTLSCTGDSLVITVRNEGPSPVPYRLPDPYVNLWMGVENQPIGRAIHGGAILQNEMILPSKSTSFRFRVNELASEQNFTFGKHKLQFVYNPSPIGSSYETVELVDRSLIIKL